MEQSGTACTCKFCLRIASSLDDAVAIQSVPISDPTNTMQTEIDIDYCVSPSLRIISTVAERIRNLSTPQSTVNEENITVSSSTLCRFQQKHPLVQDTGVYLLMLRPSILCKDDIQTLTLVNFNSTRKEYSNEMLRDVLWDTDNGIIQYISKRFDIHAYCIIQMPDKVNWTNVVIARPLKQGELPRSLMGCDNPSHDCAVSFISPRIYETVRIHRSTFVGNFVKQRGSIELNSSRYIDFGEECPSDDLPVPAIYNIIMPKMEKFAAYRTLEKERSDKLPIRWFSWLSANAHQFYADVMEYIGLKLNVEFEEVQMDHNESPFNFLNDGKADLGFFCGVMYAKGRFSDSDVHNNVSIVGAPVREDSDLPQYYGTVITKCGNDTTSLENVRNETFAYNEECSWSGFIVLDEWLQQHKKQPGVKEFFAHTIRTGSHQGSIEAVLDGTAKYACIDSVVLAMELQQRTELKTLISTSTPFPPLGPWPMPPCCVSRSISSSLRFNISKALLSMTECKEGQNILNLHGFSHFAPTTSAVYRPFLYSS